MTYKIQIDDVVRDATADEAAIIDSRRAEAQAQEEAELTKASAREALLTRLGITADEATLLFG